MGSYTNRFSETNTKFGDPRAYFKSCLLINNSAAYINAAMI